MLKYGVSDCVRALVFVEDGVEGKAVMSGARKRVERREEHRNGTAERVGALHDNNAEGRRDCGIERWHVGGTGSQERSNVPRDSGRRQRHGQDTVASAHCMHQDCEPEWLGIHKTQDVTKCQNNFQTLEQEVAEFDMTYAKKTVEDAKILALKPIIPESLF